MPDRESSPPPPPGATHDRGAPPAADHDLESLEAFAVRLVRLGGRMARDWLGSRRASHKPDDSPVTDADHAVQAALLDEIARHLPRHGVLAEETVADPSRHSQAGAEFCWVVDPIDGTRNFARGSRMFSVSLALMHRGVPVVGAMYDGRFEIVYHARRGGGAFMEDRPLRVVDGSLDGHTVMAFSSFRRVAPPAAVKELLGQVMFRNIGSLALHLAGVACGDFDATYSQEAKPWDIAAGVVLIEEAGGIVTRPDGGPMWPLDAASYAGADMPLVAAGPRRHAALVARVKSA